MKQQVSPAIIAVAVVVILGLIGGLAYMTLGRHQDLPGKNTSNPQYQNYMNHTGSGGGMGSPPGGGGPSHGMSSGGSAGYPGSGSPGH